MNFCLKKSVFLLQLSYPNTSDRQRDRADEHAVQGEVPQGHPADGGEAQQLYQRPREVGHPVQCTLPVNVSLT